jgi:hypothetical protein
MRYFTLCSLVAGCTLGLPAQAEDFADITPYRPSVANPAQLPAPGQLELELGGIRTRTGDQRSTSLPYQFKYAFSNEWGVLVGGDGYVWQREGGDRAHGVGDTTVTLKRAFALDDVTAFGLEFGATIPTAPAAIGSGKPDWTVNAIWSRDLGKLHLDANLNETRHGQPDPGASRLETGAALAFSSQLGERWTAVAELSGSHSAGAPSTAQVLTALSYAPSKTLALDAGVAHGLTRTSPDWSLFAGVVFPLAKFR